ncbi:MAG TPA: glycosyltransferase [Solirubrobacteraceae bacterium]|jgi:glycosyltransferase involved in cell wall biosynthesis
MRILVLSTLYPPVAFGGYEVECSGVVERLHQHHEVLVLSSDTTGAEETPRGEGTPRGAEETPRPEPVRRELTRLTHDWQGALRAPLASLRAVGAARRALAWEPDLIYCWNGAAIPQAALRVLADSGVPLAFRVCEHWFGGLFTADQYLRELLPAGSLGASRGLARGTWSVGCRAFNALPPLRLHPTAPLSAAISWNSEAIRRMVQTPPFLNPVLERVGHSVPRHGDLYAAVLRDPAPEPELVFLGRVTPYKGLSVAIEALALLRSEHSVSARLVVVGPEDSGHAAEMRLLAERLGVATAIEWRGQVTPEQAAAALARAHALIVPSLWEEPFPLVTIEGALARVPLVAADVGGIGEGMHDEEHALLFARGDARAAAAALARTLRDEGGETAARVARAHERAQAFRLGPYLDAQEQFVADAYAALR